MSGYASEEPIYSHQSPGELEYSYQDGIDAAQLRSGGAGIDQELKLVERLAKLRVEGNSVEATANLCLYAKLNLNDEVLREGIVNGRGGIEATILSFKLLDKARQIRDSGDHVGYTALAAIVGYYPPETSDSVITTLDPDYDINNNFLEKATFEEIRTTERPGNGG